MSNTLNEEVDNTTSEITAQEQLDIDALGFGFYKNDSAPTEVSSITATEQSEEEYEELTAEEQEDRRIPNKGIPSRVNGRYTIKCGLLFYSSRTKKHQHLYGR